MSSLRASIVPVSKLSEASIRQMYDLFEQYYECVTYEQFAKDISNKHDVIVLRDEDGQIQGISTLKNTEISISGRTHYGVFSGDTVVAKKYWGTKLIGRSFLKYLFIQKSKHPFSPFYWFLISKGYKTYLLMANNFADYYPRFERETPASAQEILDGFANSFFPDAYSPKTGLIQFEESKGQLKGGVADVCEELVARNPKIAFFQAKNPAWATGTELACIAKMTWMMPASYACKAQYRFFKNWLGRTNFLPMPSKSAPAREG